jgi:uncharacterized protein YjbI with pentapeptide repeats
METVLFDIRRGNMSKDILSKVWVLACLLSFTGLHLTVHAADKVHNVQENIQKLAKTKSCPGCDLAGAELIRMDLSGADLQGADLTGAKLFLTNLSGANLQKAHLQRASLGGADLAGADLRGVDLREVDLSSAYLTGAKLDSEQVKAPSADEEIPEAKGKTGSDDSARPNSKNKSNRASIAGNTGGEKTATADQKKDVTDSPPSAKEVAGKDKPGKRIETDSKVYTGKEKGNVTLNARPDKSSTNTGVKETTANIESLDSPPQPTQKDEIKNAGPAKKLKDEEPSAKGNIAAVNRNVEPEPVIAKKEKETPPKTDAGKQPEVSDYKAKNIAQLLGTKKCYQCDLSGVDLSGKDLGKADLEGANLKGCNLEKTDLSKANLKGASLVDANMKKADLRGADLYKADLSGSDLTNAQMENSNADEAKFSGTSGRSR